MKLKVVAAAPLVAGPPKPSHAACFLLSGLLLFSSAPAHAQAVPNFIEHQDVLSGPAANFTGTGHFKFSIVNPSGAGTAYWRNDNNFATITNTGMPIAEPGTSVTLGVESGSYGIYLGSNNTKPIPYAVFSKGPLFIRTWFSPTGAAGSFVVQPDVPIPSSAYAMSVADGSITNAKIASGAVGNSKLGTGAVTSAKIANGAVGSAQIASGGVSASQIADNTITSAKIGSGQVVKSLNGLSDAITLTAGENISITPSGNSLLLSATGGGSSIWSLNNTGYPYYNGGGFVGIGTDSPAAGLHVINSSGNTLRLDGATPRINFIDTGNANTLTGIGAQAGSFYVSNNQTGTLMQLTAGGAMGLGTATPASKLHISGNADALRLTGPQPYLTLENTSANFISRIQANGAGMDLKTNGAALNNHPGIIHLNGTGIVGLGTTTPRHHLSIRSFAGGPTWTTNGWIGAIDLDNASAIAWGANSGGQRFGMGHTNGSFVMWRTAADPGTTASGAFYDFAIADNGNVGIGTTGPATKLTVLTPTNNYGMEHTDGGIRLATYVGGSSSNGGWLGTLSNHKLNFFTNNGAAAMTMDTAGNVGIGTTTPAAKMQVSSGGNIGAPQALITQTTAGDFARLRLSAAGSASSWDVAAGSAGGVLNFYAASTGTDVMSLNPNGVTTVRTLSITGGADLAEPFQMKENELEKGSVVVIDEEHPGRLKRSTRPYDRQVAGIISGANGVNPGISLQQEGLIEGGQNVALSGRVYVRANKSGGRIKPGDLLTTSAQPGEAMRVKNHTRSQGAVIGKAMSELDEETGTVLVLVTLQ